MIDGLPPPTCFDAATDWQFHALSPSTQRGRLGERARTRQGNETLEFGAVPLTLAISLIEFFEARFDFVLFAGSNSDCVALIRAHDHCTQGGPLIRQV